MSRKRYDEAFKRKVIQEYEAGEISCYGLGKKYGVDAKCVRSWCRLYKHNPYSFFTKYRKFPKHDSLQKITNYVSTLFYQSYLFLEPEKHVLYLPFLTALYFVYKKFQNSSLDINNIHPKVPLNNSLLILILNLYPNQSPKTAVYHKTSQRLNIRHLYFCLSPSLFFKNSCKSKKIFVL